MPRSKPTLVFALAALVLGGALQAQTPAAPAAGAQGGRGGAPLPVIGPSAPVPPEVAIPRPTADEVAQVNASLQRFVDSDRTTVQPLLKKYQPLFMLQQQR